ncbi:NUDIX domain-containing protein [Flexivirga sp. B27]
MKLRESVRALIVDPDDHVLLVRFDWDGLDLDGGFWANPGGGIEPGETRLAAIQRELREETGLYVDHLGPELWTKTAHFEMADWDGQVDHIHLHRVEHFDPAPEMSPEQLAAEHVHEVRWWSPDEISSGSATFAPRALAALLRELREHGTPDRPVELSGF